MSGNMFRNPIIPGCYPDPSICRAGEDYYLVASTFEYFPGVPIFHSRDLVNWRQIGHVLDRPSQLNLDGIPGSKGIYAPTIRYHAGVYYLITTFVESVTGARRNFYVTAAEPAGDWSDPVWLPEAAGIDSSLFFDDDGRCYCMANRQPPAGQQYPKHMEIWLQELDLTQGKLVDEAYSLWDGALKQIHAQEAPHIYKLDGYYYLMIAEGGTGHTHSITVARSKNITGPYEGCKQNPILTHRHLGHNYPIVNVGHGDLVQTTEEDWWMVCLASRPYGGYYRNLGRETFLAKVVWEAGWPVVNPGTGKLESAGEGPCLPQHRWPSLPACDHFEADQLDQRWNFVRTPRGDFWSLSKRPGYLRLQLKSESMTEPGNPSFVGRRQQHINFAVRTALEFSPATEQETAGLILRQSEQFQFRVECTLSGGNRILQLIQRRDGVEAILSRCMLPDAADSRLYLKVEATGQAYGFHYALRLEEWKCLYDGADGTILSSDVAGGFVGAYIGLFASSQGTDSDNYADIDWFEYIGLPDGQPSA